MKWTRRVRKCHQRLQNK